MGKAAGSGKAEHDGMGSHLCLLNLVAGWTQSMDTAGGHCLKPHSRPWGTGRGVRGLLPPTLWAIEVPGDLRPSLLTGNL